MQRIAATGNTIAKCITHPPATCLAILRLSFNKGACSHFLFFVPRSIARQVAENLIAQCNKASTLCTKPQQLATLHSVQPLRHTLLRKLSRVTVTELLAWVAAVFWVGRASRDRAAIELLAALLDARADRTDWGAFARASNMAACSIADSRIKLTGCSSKLSKETPKTYHIGCGFSQFYSLKVTSLIFIHRNNTGMLNIIAKGQQVLLLMNRY